MQNVNFNKNVCMINGVFFLLGVNLYLFPFGGINIHVIYKVYRYIYICIYWRLPERTKVTVYSSISQ